MHTRAAFWELHDDKTLRQPRDQQTRKAARQADRTQAALLSSATDTDTYVILKYLSRTHIFEIVFSGFVFVAEFLSRQSC